jgi:hypothetical protein
MLTQQQIINQIGSTIRRGNVVIRVRDYAHAKQLFSVQSEDYYFEAEGESRECNACQA